MSKNAKILLVAAGALAALLLTGILGIAFLVYQTGGKAGYEKTKALGADFGKTTDSDGCQAEGISRIRNLGLFDITKSVDAQHFVEGCLESSRQSQNFCQNVPTEFEDIWAKDAWKDAECRKLGWAEMNPNCRAVMRARLEFCEKSR